MTSSIRTSKLVIFSVLLTLFQGVHAQVFAEEVNFQEPALSVGKEAFNAKIGTIYQIRIDQLRPLQVGFGPGEVKSRLQNYIQKNLEQKKKYIQKKVVDVTIGPDAQIYLLDGHHMARLLIEANQPVILAKVNSIYKDGDLLRFYLDLDKNKNIYLFDGEKRIDPKDLPKKISELKPDPYRDLAWELQNSGDIEEVQINFIEFEWARLLFRKKIAVSEINSDYAAAVAQARILSHGEEAKALFTGKGYLPAPRNN
jgi:hypothetical protein